MIVSYLLVVKSIMEIIKNIRGGQKLCLDGYMYTKKLPGKCIIVGNVFKENLSVVKDLSLLISQ